MNLLYRNARARLQQQQKQRLQTAKDSGANGIYAPNDMLRKKKDDNLFEYQPAAQQDDDFANLMKYHNTNTAVYDPTLKSGVLSHFFQILIFQTKSNLPSLSKTSNIITYNVEEHNPQLNPPVKREEERALEQQYQYEEVKEQEQPEKDVIYLKNFSNFLVQ